MIYMSGVGILGEACVWEDTFTISCNGDITEAQICADLPRGFGHKSAYVADIIDAAIAAVA